MISPQQYDTKELHDFKESAALPSSSKEPDSAHKSKCIFFPLGTLTGKRKATHLWADGSITKLTTCSKNQTLAAGYSSEQEWSWLNREKVKQMRSSVTIKRDNTDAREKKKSPKGKLTFKQLHRHWTHKLNGALTGYTISIQVWGRVKLFVLETQRNLQTKLKMEAKPLQTIVSPSSDMVKNLTFNDKQLYISWEEHGKNKCFICFKNECPDSWLKQTSW